MAQSGMSTISTVGLLSGFIITILVVGAVNFNASAMAQNFSTEFAKIDSKVDSLGKDVEKAKVQTEVVSEQNDKISGLLTKVSSLETEISGQKDKIGTLERELAYARTRLTPEAVPHGDCYGADYEIAMCLAPQPSAPLPAQPQEPQYPEDYT